MILCSTKNSALSVSFTDAVRQGMAPDGGLFVPASVAECPSGFMDRIGHLAFREISFEVARLLIGDEIPETELGRIVSEAMTFDAPLRRLDERTAVLELFHGPTLAFKDFGARFMARTMAYVRRGESREYTVLVATSGDTGSAVADAFHGAPGVSVVLLYPSGRVSPTQESQLTTLSGNVTALEIEGTFDDCQHLVKQSFADREIASRRNLTSANSINVARLIPQTFYYFNAFARLGGTTPVVYSVPSGNFGNLTAGLLARKMGLPVSRFVAAMNVNGVVGQYLATGVYTPGKAVTTLSNAMDVADPGNLPRIRALFNDDLGAMRNAVFPATCTDDQTREAIADAFDRFSYVFDPHGAVGYFGLARYREGEPGPVTGIVLATAHPSKFIEAYDGAIREAITVPERLRDRLKGERRSVKLPANFEEVKAFLMAQ